MLLQIIKKTPILLCAGAMLVFTSCNSDEAGKTDTENSMETVNDKPRDMPNINGSTNNTPTNGAGNSTMQNPTPTNNGSANLNPPHGEPGHDCAVPVGQPLSSNAGGAPTMPTMTTPVNTPNSNNATNLNPPHGQPGHDCAIAVGDPLN